MSKMLVLLHTSHRNNTYYYYNGKLTAVSLIKSANEKLIIDHVCQVSCSFMFVISGRLSFLEQWRVYCHFLYNLECPNCCYKMFESFGFFSLFGNNESFFLASFCSDLNYRHRNAQMASRASVELHTIIYFRKRYVNWTLDPPALSLSLLSLTTVH